jgi:hypothetical protein
MHLCSGEYREWRSRPAAVPRILPKQKLGAIVGEGFCPDDIEVAGLQGVGQIDEHADVTTPRHE